MSTRKFSDIACTVAGLALILSLAWAVAGGQTEWTKWRAAGHAVWAAAGLVLLLPFDHLETLIPLLGDYLPGGGDDA